MIASNKDQDDFDKQPAEYHEHLTKAFLHHTGHGPHPGAYSPLQELREEMEYPPSPADIQKEQPTPPEEAMGPQPPMSGSKGDRGQKPTSAGTPTAIGQAAAAPVPPPGEGDF